MTTAAPTRKIGLLAHGAEGGALCYLTMCREGQALLGAHMHPEIIVHSTPLGLSLAAFDAGDNRAVGDLLRRSVELHARNGWLVAADPPASASLPL